NGCRASHKPTEIRTERDDELIATANESAIRVSPLRGRVWGYPFQALSETDLLLKKVRACSAIRHHFFTFYGRFAYNANSKNSARIESSSDFKPRSTSFC